MQFTFGKLAKHEAAATNAFDSNHLGLSGQKKDHVISQSRKEEN
jgi:hypothetical protein